MAPTGAPIALPSPAQNFPAPRTGQQWPGRPVQQPAQNAITDRVRPASRRRSYRVLGMDRTVARPHFWAWRLLVPKCVDGRTGNQAEREADRSASVPVR